MLTGIIYREAKKYPKFIHLKSHFKDCWYNYLAPTVPAADFPWDKSSALIEHEAKNGFDLTFYIHSSLLGDYKTVLEKNGHKKIGSEVYMLTTLTQPYPNIKCQYLPVTKANLAVTLEMTKACFPKWENNEEYSRYFFNLSQATSGPSVENFLSKVGDNYVGFGSIVISRLLGLSYLHNTGVLQAYRRRGYYSDFVRYRCNQSLKLGAKKVFALVEKDSGSYHGLQKLGFHPEETYYLFSGKIL